LLGFDIGGGSNRLFLEDLFCAGAELDDDDDTDKDDLPCGFLTLKRTETPLPLARSPPVGLTGIFR